jgi:hypothetical protein
MMMITLSKFYSFLDFFLLAILLLRPLVDALFFTGVYLGAF